MSEEFCSGVKVLLQRMDTNPEEFVYGSLSDDYDDTNISESKWYKYLPTRSDKYMEDEGDDLCIGSCELYLTEAEKHALRTKLCKIYRDQYSGLVMTELMVTKPKRKK